MGTTTYNCDNNGRVITEYNEETGLYYLRARYYDSSLARFISKDSYEGQVTNPESLNQYTYCDNNPEMFVDPTGHRPANRDKLQEVVEQEQELEKAVVVAEQQLSHLLL